MAKGWLGVVDRGTETLINDTERVRRPFAFMCPKPNCYCAKAAKSREHAEKIEREHKCPYIGGITHIGSSVTRTILETAWEDADALYAQMTDDEKITEEQRKLLGAQLNGMCRVIAKFMPPIFRTAKEIGDEIRKRYNMRSAGEEYETPGLNSRRHEFTNAQRVLEGKPPVMPPGERAKKVLSTKEREAIAFAKASGMFTNAQLAETYEVTEAVIAAL
jgi:hypothetical protein